MYQIKERFDATKVRKKNDICKIFANKKCHLCRFLHKWHEKKRNVNGSVAFFVVLLPHFHTSTLKKESKYKLENLKSDLELIDRCCGVLLTRAQ